MERIQDILDAIGEIQSFIYGMDFELPEITSWLQVMLADKR